MFNNIDRDGYFIIYMFVLPILGLILGYATAKPQKYTTARYRRWPDENSGEKLVRNTLKEYCKNKDAHVLNCVTLRLEDGSTTQIDHILICTKGIFVIETKHFTGWIFGSLKSKVWAKINYEQKHKFQNPLHQNYKHVKEIQRTLDFLEPRHIHNIVVFSGDSEFKTAKIENVCYLDELIPNIEKHSNSALSLNRIQFCVGRLEYMRLELTQKTDIEHQKYLAQKFCR